MNYDWLISTQNFQMKQIQLTLCKTINDVISSLQQFQDPMQILSAEKTFFNKMLDREIIEKN